MGTIGHNEQIKIMFSLVPYVNVLHCHNYSFCLNLYQSFTGASVSNDNLENAEDDNREGGGAGSHVKVIHFGIV